MLNEVIRTTLVEFGDRVRGFAPNILAMLVVLLVGTLAAGAVRSGLAFLLPRLGVDRFAERSGLGDVAAGPADAPALPHHLRRRGVGGLAVFFLLAVAALDVRVAVDLARGLSPGCPTSSWRWRSCSRAGSWPDSPGAAC